MRWQVRFWIAALLLAALPVAALATVVDAKAAEAAYMKGDFKAARAGFEQAIEQFRAASKDSLDTSVYREAAYLYDRLADCCFTERDWEGLKLYTDGLLVVAVSERNLNESRLAGALESGIAYASARFLAERLDESVRFGSLVQLKRSLALALLESGGTGKLGDGAIALYQQLAALWRQALVLDAGIYSLEVNILNGKVEDFDKVYTGLAALVDVEALWKKYPPESKKDVGLKPPPRK